MSTTTFAAPDLARAFEILLGRPLDDRDPDVVYAVYTLPSAECFGAYTQLTVENLTATTLPDAVHRVLDDHTDNPAGAGRTYDLGGSLFFFAAEDVEDGGSVAYRDITAVGLPCDDENGAVLTGRAVADLPGLDLTSCDGSDNAGLTDLAIRLLTDGTLYGAMAVATATDGEVVPRAFADISYVSGPDPAWVEPLSRIDDPVLREHLSTYCLSMNDARCDYWYFAGPDTVDEWGWLGFPEASALGWELVAGWHLTDGPGAATVIVRMPR